MKSSEAIKAILMNRGRSQRSLALELRISPQGLDQRFKSKTMRVGTLCEMASMLGYSVQLVSDDGKTRIPINE